MKHEKMFLRPSHNDRSLSLDSPNHLVHLLSHSPAPTTAKQSSNKLPSYPPRYVPFKNVTNQDSLRNILNRQNLGNNSPSPCQNSFSTVRSPSMSILPGPTELSNKRRAHERTRSAYPDKENDYEKSLIYAVKAAQDLQVEKERDFSQEKISLEQEILQQSRLVEKLSERVGMNEEVNRRCRANLSETLGKAQDLVEKTVINSDSIWADIPLSLTAWDEKIKGLLNANRNLKGSLSKLVSSSEWHSGKKAKLLDDLSESEKELEPVIEQVSILAHKMTEAEEKERQMRECKQMAEEDIHSHVVAVTESIFMQEEASDIIDSLSWKDPQAFECIKNEMSLDKRLSEIELDLEIQVKDLDSSIQSLNADQKEVEARRRHLKESLENVASLTEKIRIFESEMFGSKSSVISRLDHGLRKIGVQKRDWENILAYFKMFELGPELGPIDRMTVIRYQKEALEEILFIIRQNQTIANMEAMFLSKGRRSASCLGERKPSQVYDSTGPARELQNELVNRKLELNEKLAGFKANKIKALEKVQNSTRDWSALGYHTETSLLELLKGLEEPSDRRMIEDVILEVVSRAEATWKAYLLVVEEMSIRQKESRNIEDGLEVLVETVQKKAESLEQKKSEITAKDSEVENILSQLRYLEDKYLENDKKRREEVEEGFGKDVRSETMLERQQVKTKRGDSLTKLKRNFSTVDSKIKDLRKLKEEIVKAEDLIKKLEGYRNKILSKIETELKGILKRYAGQAAEFKMKTDVVQGELLTLLEQEEGLIWEIEKVIYMNYDQGTKQKNVLLAEIALQAFICKSFISDLIKELRGRLLDKFTRSFLEGTELTFIEIDEINKIIEKIQHIEMPRLEKDDTYHVKTMEAQLFKYRDSLQEKRERLVSVDKEMEKYKHFYEISNELLRDKTQFTSKDSTATSHLSVSLMSVQKENSLPKSKSPSPIPNLTLHSRNLSVLDSSKYSTKFDLHSGLPGSRDERDDKLNIDTFGMVKQENERELGYITPKELTDVQAESNWLKGMDIPSLENSTTKTYSSSLNFQSTSIKSAHSDKRDNSAYAYASIPNEGKTVSVSKADKVPKCLGVSEEEFRSLIQKFEIGFIVYKRFAGSNKVEEKVSVSLSMKGRSKPKKDLIGYGRRVLRLNIKEKTIEVLKFGVAGSRTILEYKYEWENLKQVMLPQKTLEILRESDRSDIAIMDQEEIEEDAFVIKASVDVVNKGRIDLLLWNSCHVIALWNVVHRISIQGSLYGKS